MNIVKTAMVLHFQMAEKDAAHMCTCRTGQTSVTADSGYGDRYFFFNCVFQNWQLISF